MVEAIEILFKKAFQTFLLITFSALSLLPYFKESNALILCTSKKENQITVFSFWRFNYGIMFCITENLYFTFIKRVLLDVGDIGFNLIPLRQT